MGNDRFKFRVWDKAENKYNGFPFLLTMPGKLDRLSIDGDLLATDENRFTIEQCTGVKDKNGKLIYVGDVIKIVGGAFIPIGVKLEVCYGWVSWQLRDLVHGGYLDFYCGGNTFEIIGNIHETKENT